MNALKYGSPSSLAESQGFEWNINTYKTALAHTKGMLASVDEVVMNGGRSGSLSSGLHHASPSSGAGFCSINGIALAAFRVIQHGLKALILDFDAHCGGGTMSHVREYMGWNQNAKEDDITQVDVSVSLFDQWPDYRGDRNILIMSSGSEYKKDICRALRHANKFVTADTVVIYNAGVDIVNCDPDITYDSVVEREKLVSEWVGDIPSVFALAGGYIIGDTTQDDVVDLHRITIKEMAHVS